MAGYNPQRNRPRPTLAEDSPAPVDALLGSPDTDEMSVAAPKPTPEPTPEPTPLAAPESAPADAAVPTTVAPDPVPVAPYVPTVPSAAQRSRSRLIMMAGGSLLAIVLVVVLRRRRRS
jgi:hypothetical protein